MIVTWTFKKRYRGIKWASLLLLFVFSHKTQFQISVFRMHEVYAHAYNEPCEHIAERAMADLASLRCCGAE